MKNNPPINDLVQRSMGVYTVFSRRAIQISNNPDIANRKSEERPQKPEQKAWSRRREDRDFT